MDRLEAEVPTSDYEGNVTGTEEVVVGGVGGTSVKGARDGRMGKGTECDQRTI